MLFTCTPGQLAAHIIGKVAVADSVSLEQLWSIVLEKTQNHSVDNMQKNVAWRSIMGAAGNILTVKVAGTDLSVSSSLQYGELMLHGTETEITLHPTEECQARYLIGTENYKSTRTSLGDMPFQLLVIIARHGKEGILNPDLAKESGQDARSLWMRVQKLEAAGLIKCSSVYEKKNHTTRSVHVKFCSDGILQQASESMELNVSRDVGKIKKFIVEALKAAPNQLRGSSDLAKELKLHDGGADTKFFRAICMRLSRDGYIEKVRVEMPETGQRLFALKFVRDLPKDTEAMDFGDLGDENDDETDNEEANEEENENERLRTVPLINHIFPIFHQVYHQIELRGSKGATTSEVANSLMGLSEYKPYVRIYESMPSYISNSKNLKPSKKLGDHYPDYTLTKLYDNEGKLKFYRFFVTHFCLEEKPTPKLYTAKTAVAKELLVQLNKKLCSTLGKASHDVLLDKKRRMLQVSAVPAKKQRAQRAQSEDLVELALEELPKRRRAKQTYADDFMDLDSGQSDDDFDPTHKDILKMELNDRDLGKPEEAPLLLSSHLPKFIPKMRESKKGKGQPLSYKLDDSHRSMTRRDALMDIIREHGGAMFSDSRLIRLVDKRLGNSTTTDPKTLLRDVEQLAKSHMLEVLHMQVAQGALTIDRRLLILADPEERPLQQHIENFIKKHAKKDMKELRASYARRMIQAEVKLVIEKPRVKEPPKPRGKNRLQALGDAPVEKAPPVKKEKVQKIEPDIMTKIKKSKRPKKVAQKDDSNEDSPLHARRSRRNIHLDKAESTIVYRAVVIYKAFSRHAIDFDRIAALVGEHDGKTLRRKWGTLRRSYGGAAAVDKGVETFQNMVMQGIEDGSITESQLVARDLEFFLNYWKEFDLSSEFYVLDKMPLFATTEQNETAYDIVKSPVDQPGYFERIEDNSMRQKESVLSQAIFSYEPEPEPVAKPLDEIRAVLKSMFLATKEDPGISKPILEKYGEAMVRKACSALMKDKEISYVSLESDQKFIVGDRFHNSLVLKIFTPKFFHQAASFKDTLSSISRSGKGLVVSQAIMPGQMASLLEMISSNRAELIRIDRTFRVESYESRLIDKELIACDIIAKCDFETVDKIQVQPTPLPYRAPYQPIWIQVDSLVNKLLWTKIVLTMLFQVVFKPGIGDLQLYTKLQTVLSLQDYYAAIEWLISSRCVEKLDSGYSATDRWQYIFGY